MYEKGFNELKSYLNKKMNLKDMNWDTLLKKIGAIAEVVEEESKEEEPKAEVVEESKDEEEAAAWDTYWTTTVMRWKR